MVNFGYSKKTNLGFNDAVTRVRAELSKEGFGVITEINVKDTLKKKLDINFNNYLILGACNPSFAHRALLAEIEIGLMLPCNIIVYENNGDVIISSILPSIAMNMIDNNELKDIANQVEKKLRNVIEGCIYERI